MQYWAGARETLIQTGNICEDLTKEAEHQLALGSGKERVGVRWGWKGGQPRQM